MTMPILKLTAPIPDIIANDEKFRLMLETHRPYLRQPNNCAIHAVDSHNAFKFRYDLYGYLTHASVNPELHFATMRLSDLESPLQFDETTELLIIPKADVYSKLKALYITSLGKLGKS